VPNRDGVSSNLLAQRRQFSKGRAAAQASADLFADQAGEIVHMQKTPHLLALRSEADVAEFAAKVVGCQAFDPQRGFIGASVVGHDDLERDALGPQWRRQALNRAYSR
jgi:hypothetical protein